MLKNPRETFSAFIRGVVEEPPRAFYSAREELSVAQKCRDDIGFRVSGTVPHD